ncbi:MAG: hypothetical protein AAGA32_22585 [Pseudomonadota bacterium]
MGEYLDELQTDAYRLASLLDGLSVLQNDGGKAAEDCMTGIIDIAASLASDLGNRLDFINRPAAEGGSK